jgi:hypothetical protein
MFLNQWDALVRKMAENVLVKAYYIVIKIFDID